MNLNTHSKSNIGHHNKTIKSGHPRCPSDDVESNHEEPDEEISNREDEEAMVKILPATATRAEDTHGGPDQAGQWTVQSHLLFIGLL